MTGIAEELARSPLALNNLDHAWLNLPTATLYEHALRNKEAHLTRDGALLVRHAHDSDPSLKNKYIVDDPLIDCHAEHGEFQQHLSEAEFEALFDRMRSYLAGEKCMSKIVSSQRNPATISPCA